MRKLLKKQGFAPTLLTTDKTRLLRICFPAPAPDLLSSAGTAEEQSGRELPSSGAATRAQNAAFQISSIRSAF
jgi:hypothetical protein